MFKEGEEDEKGKEGRGKKYVQYYAQILNKSSFYWIWKFGMWISKFQWNLKQGKYEVW